VRKTGSGGLVGWKNLQIRVRVRAELKINEVRDRGRMRGEVEEDTYPQRDGVELHGGSPAAELDHGSGERNGV
jgi:hypothetical protein